METPDWLLVFQITFQTWCNCSQRVSPAHSNLEREGVFFFKSKANLNLSSTDQARHGARWNIRVDQVGCNGGDLQVKCELSMWFSHHHCNLTQLRWTGASGMWSVCHREEWERFQPQLEGWKLPQVSLSCLQHPHSLCFNFWSIGTPKLPLASDQTWKLVPSSTPSTGNQQCQIV